VPTGGAIAGVARVVPADAVGTATAGVAFFTFIAYVAAPPLFAALVVLAGYETAV